MLDKLLLQIASDLCSFCHLGNFVGEIPAGRKGNNLFTADVQWVPFDTEGHKNGIKRGL